MNDKRRWALSFFLGLLVGGTLVGAASHHYFCHWGKAGELSENRGNRWKEYMAELNDKLRLTPEQNQKVTAILELKHLKMDASRQSTRAGMKKFRDEARAEIRAVLSEEQKPVFEIIVEERRKKWEAREKSERQ